MAGVAGDASLGSARRAPLPAVIDPNRASASALGQDGLDTVGRAGQGGFATGFARLGS